MIRTLRSVGARSIRMRGQSAMALSSKACRPVLSRPFQRAFSDGSDADFAPKRKVPEGIAEAQEKIKKDIETNDVFLYMKGIPQAPQCGFSNQVCRVLDHVGVKYGSRNILAEPDVREGIKLFSNWPTLPQLYVKGEFVGGCDIVVEMFREGELTALFEEHKIPLTPPKKE